jgi:uncharacterized protein (DUF1810 family)
MAGADPFDLERFRSAQEPVWEAVRAELAQGRKTTHWMWFIFPQLTVLGRSATARFYGLSGLAEARSYLADPVLGPRLLEACRLLSGLATRDAQEVFGSIDAMKLRSCLTLFARAAAHEQVFTDCLAQYFGGAEDPLTLQYLSAAS